MPEILPPGFGEVVVPFTHEGLGRSSVITFGIQPGGLALPDPSANVQASIDEFIVPTLDTNVSAGPVEVRVGQDGGEPITYFADHSTVGTKSTNSLAANSALLVKKLTARGGKRGRGRMFFPWVLGEDEVDEIGVVAPSVVTSLQAGFNDWLDDLETRFVPMVLLHSSGISAPGSPNTVTRLVVDRLIGTQRRRLGR
jgi:hypothetical protein